MRVCGTLDAHRIWRHINLRTTSGIHPFLSRLKDSNYHCTSIKISIRQTPWFKSSSLSPSPSAQPLHPSSHQPLSPSSRLPTRSASHRPHTPASPSNSSSSPSRARTPPVSTKSEARASSTWDPVTVSSRVCFRAVLEDRALRAILPATLATLRRARPGVISTKAVRRAALGAISDPLELRFVLPTLPLPMPRDTSTSTLLPGVRMREENNAHSRHDDMIA
ncbi:hypothetical protein EJ05DRAFT_235015 [Pseudovirgaria hyperparasitica]|uniref:Uncharacterized protein n=1 Tax=Pseudovirgaria hyperparasitica TaxID=470096 RepID=A0A6A6VUC3_9PEZI|nr:uncharacterized protein EJ05DRAFT_235015 [Pseudovirgaria hyperparasitica]KAF2752847.1 hypothetical protein EJ05DRAFT_235015 [Pseudovirgaria hyperparasitica]